MICKGQSFVWTKLCVQNFAWTKTKGIKYVWTKIAWTKLIMDLKYLYKMFLDLILVVQKIVNEIFLDTNQTEPNYVRAKFMWTINCWTNIFWTKRNCTKC